MVALTFPDGARRDYPNGITGLEVSEPVKQSNWFDIRVKEARRYSIVPRSTT